jgi:uncharacterized protein with NRDE domain
VLLRFAPDARWPVLLGAVRDEFVDRPWEAPGRHWDGPAAGLVGGVDRVAGGTWLAVDPAAPATAAVLNGPPRGFSPDRVRPSRGGLPLAALTGAPLPDPSGYDSFHLLRATLDAIEVWSWDGVELRHQQLDPGDHILVNAGVDVPDHPLVSHFRPRLRAATEPDPRPGSPPERAWKGWLPLIAGDGLDPSDPRALIVRREFDGRTYGSGSASLLALAPGTVRFDFTATPGPVATWSEVRI